MNELAAAVIEILRNGLTVSDSFDSGLNCYYHGEVKKYVIDRSAIGDEIFNEFDNIEDAAHEYVNFVRAYEHVG